MATYDIFEGTEQIQQLVIARAISGMRIEEVGDSGWASSSTCVLVRAVSEEAEDEPPDPLGTGSSSGDDRPRWSRRPGCGTPPTEAAPHVQGVAQLAGPVVAVSGHGGDSSQV